MSKTRLFILQPTVVFRARFQQEFAVFPMGELPWEDLMAGSYEAIQPEMTIRIGTSFAQDDHGRQRIRKAATADTLYIGRSSPGTNDGEVYPVAGDFIDVLNLRVPFAKIPFINGNGEIFEDHEIAWDEQTGSEKPPKSNILPEAFAGTISSGVLEVDFDGTDSYAQADGASISTYLWDVGDGTITTGTSASSTITATFPAGFRYVSLTVTDSNGITHTTYVPVYARDPANDTTIGNYQIERRSWSKDGQTVALRILEDIPAGTYPDGTLVMLFNEPTGPDDRPVLFYGWHHIDPAQIQAGRTGILRDVVFECLDIAGKMATLPGFPITVENKTAPTSWLHMSGANMDRYIDRLLRWRSNAFELAHYTPSGTGSDYPFVVLGSDAQSLWQQATRRAHALVPDYHLTCNSRGRLSVVIDPMLQETADRTSTVQATLTEADWSDIRYTRQRAPRVHWLRSEAILASATQIAAIFTVAPDTTPGQGSIEQTHGEQLAKSHVDLMNAEGHRYARLNARESHFTITLAEGDEQGIEPAALTWVKLTISTATAAQRGLTFTEARGLVHQVDVRYQHERTGTIKTVTLTWERETAGTPAAPHIPPDTEFPDDWEPEPDGGFEPAPTGSESGLGTTYVATASKLGRTRDFSAESPEWVDITPSGVTVIYDFILDPWAPATTAYLHSEDGVHKSTNMDQATPTWSNVLTTAEMNTGTGGTFLDGGRIMGSINTQDYIVVFIQNTGAGNDLNRRLWCARSTDGGANWSFADVAGANHWWWGGGADIVPRLIGGNIVLYTALTIGSDFSLRKSTDGGATWSTIVTDMGGDRGACTTVHCPYNDNATGTVVYVVSRNDSSGGRSSIYRAVSTTVDVLYSESIRLWVRRMGVESYTQNRQQVYFWTNGNANSDGLRKLHLSDDGGDSFSEIVPSGLTGVTKATGGFPFTSGRYYVASEVLAAYGAGGIFISTDGGLTFTSKTGDFVSAVGGLDFDHGVGSNARLFGTIVPLWVEE